jgi:hypothetical protein
VLALLAKQLQRSDATKATLIGLISERDPVSTRDRSLNSIALLIKTYGVFSGQAPGNIGTFSD